MTTSEPTVSEEQTKADIALLDNLLGVEARKPGKAAGLPAAIRIIETLEPAGGKDIPVFPASYAGARDSDPPVYDLAGIEYGEGEDLVRVKGGKTASVQRILKARFCAIDSPQSQANRMEPAFLESDELKALVPQAVATIPRREDVVCDDSVLLLPHRVADFRVRLSDRGEDVSSAITSFQRGDALPLLRLFPTSLIFGFWNSRGDDEHGVKHARMLLSRIDAHDVIPCRRRSLYSGPYSKDEFAEVILDDKAKANEIGDNLSKEGFSNALSDALGGVLVQGKIERTSVLSLSDIARIHCDLPEAEQDNDAPAKRTETSQPTAEQLTNAARRYLFVLAALAEAYERSKGSHRLRSGCELIGVKEPQFELRGAKFDDKDDLKTLYNHRARLIAVAMQAKEVLSVQGTLESFVVSGETLRGEVVGADELAKEIEKLTKEVEKAEEKATKAEKDAEEKETKAAESGQKRAQTSAQKAREKAEKLRREAEEKRSELTAKLGNNPSADKKTETDNSDGSQT